MPECLKASYLWVSGLLLVSAIVLPTDGVGVGDAVAALVDREGPDAVPWVRQGEVGGEKANQQ